MLSAQIRMIESTIRPRQTGKDQAELLEEPVNTVALISGISSLFEYR
jgi:hypothetical protein